MRIVIEVLNAELQEGGVRFKSTEMWTGSETGVPRGLRNRQLPDEIGGDAGHGTRGRREGEIAGDAGRAVVVAVTSWNDGEPGGVDAGLAGAQGSRRGSGEGEEGEEDSLWCTLGG